MIEFMRWATDVFTGIVWFISYMPGWSFAMLLFGSLLLLSAVGMGRRGRPTGGR